MSPAVPATPLAPLEASFYPYVLEDLWQMFSSQSPLHFRVFGASLPWIPGGRECGAMLSCAQSSDLSGPLLQAS